MRIISLGDSGMQTSALGFGCASVLGRVGRKASLAAISAAFDAGITFFDTARSYGYGEAEALLGEFLRERRHSVLLSTKFGILPSSDTLLKRSLKPVARQLLKLAPSAREWLQRPLAAQSSSGHFRVADLHQSLHASMRALRTDYIDLLFMHNAPATVLHRQDLIASLQQLVAAGKIRRFGIASQPSEIEAALDLEAALRTGIGAIQIPCSLMDRRLSPSAEASMQPIGGLISIANHPFGGAQGIKRCRSLLQTFALAPATPEGLRVKLRAHDPSDPCLIADVVLNTIPREPSIHVVVASMMQSAHLRANIAAIERSRFTPEELRWLRDAFRTASVRPASARPG